MQSDIVMTTHSPLLQSTRLRKSTTGKITGRVMRRGSGWEEIRDQWLLNSGKGLCESYGVWMCSWSLWGFPFSWHPVRHVHCSNPMRFLYLALQGCMSKPNLKFHHPPSLCPPALTCRRAHDPPHTSQIVVSRAGRWRKQPNFSTGQHVTKAMFCFFCQQVTGTWLSWFFKGCNSQRPLAALQTLLQNPKALETAGYDCTNLGAACAKVSHSAACATSLDKLSSNRACPRAEVSVGKGAHWDRVDFPMNCWLSFSVMHHHLWRMSLLSPFAMV